MELPLIERALRLAAKGHRDQVRKEGDIPYIVHPVAVAWTLRDHGFSDEVVAAALAHDLLEDTAVTEEEIRAELGDEVTRIVRAVTNDDSLSWKEKKQKYIDTVRLGGEGAWAVATADKIHNAESLMSAYQAQGDALWKSFNATAADKLWFEEAMLSMLKEVWQHPLVDTYEGYVTRMRELV